MCRLVGWVARAPTTLAEVLGEAGLDELAALSRQHADGWGMAWWEGDELRVHTSHLPAHSSPDYAAVVREVHTDAALLHLRWATPGIAVAAGNTHPFVVDDWAFGHNGAVRPAADLLDLLSPDEIAALRGDTDSERLLHVLLARVRSDGLDDGVRRTVADVCRDLTPSSLNALLLGRDELTAICCHGGPAQGDAPIAGAPPEDQPGYFDLCRRRGDGVEVVASEPLGSARWDRMSNGTALIVPRRGEASRTVDVGRFSPDALARERSRREAAARVRTRNNRETVGVHAGRMTTTFPTARVRVGCDFSFAIPAPISAVFQIEPQDEPRQRVLEHSLSFVPAGTHTTYQDTFGNRCSRLNIPPGSFEIHYEATLEVPRIPDDTDPDAPEMPIGEVPSEVLLYLLPSAFCLSDVLVNEAWARFGGLAPGWGRVQAIVTAVHEHLLFGYGTSSPTYTAADAFAAGQGVCRDFAHLAITFCRALNIPARYVFGYIPAIDVPLPAEPMDFAAWFEAYLDGRWQTFDARNNKPRIGRVVVGRGRDATDVALITSFGPLTLTGFEVRAHRSLASASTDAAPDRNQAGPGEH